MSRLLVCIPDRVTDILVKGEFQPNYYNPGELFDEVHILMTNDDRPSVDALRPIVGRARVAIHNTSWPDFKQTWGYRPRYLRPWADEAVAIASSIKPNLVRAYGHHVTTFAAAEIKRRLGVPLVVSLHGNPDIDYFRGRLGKTWQQRLEGWASRSHEKESLRTADMVLPVYSPIVPFLRSIGIRRYEVVYNAVGLGISPRTDYTLSSARIRAICVGRQEPQQKNPRAIIEAMKGIEDLYLDLIGDGPLHDGLVELASRLDVSSRVNFHRNMPNSSVLDLLTNSDLFIYQSDNYELSKGTMEAALAGLPIVLNNRKGGVADEIRNGPFLIVDDSADGYRDGLCRIVDDAQFREDLGRRAAAYAWRTWDPKRMEAKVVDIYRSLMREHPLA